MGSEIEQRADFSQIRYGQCWEDADILLAALAIRPGGTYLSIGAAGDNALAMVAQGPARVVALDLSGAQLACLALRVAAYRCLTHPELLGLLGATAWEDRAALYQRCRPHLTPAVQAFWDQKGGAIAQGIGGAGKFEHYFRVFRRWVLPWVHSPQVVRQLLAGGDQTQRQVFYDETWDTWRWRQFFRLFFSRWVLGRLGRDPSFFDYVTVPVAERLLARTAYALTQLDPASNPYLQWILTGTFQTALPYALRPENFAAIRANLDCLEWHEGAVEDYLAQTSPGTFDGYNLSDIFEYLSLSETSKLLEKLAVSGKPGGRLVYWNMLAPRQRPPALATQLKPRPDLADPLFAQDKAFFYSAFVVEEIL